ncbi:hypothetical protein B0T22DRAFT_93471 [Podospora appendiculata]|uniref:Secreted protein n=1 Tax=Podospora appendiculata TaxID=314037 RepID=A0AAE0XKB5_9PEZI|nr:hypothetical protein B0T22DRAFT_93471 [Podospora appendiculata]
MGACFFFMSICVRAGYTQSIALPCFGSPIDGEFKAWMDSCSLLSNRLIRRRHFILRKVKRKEKATMSGFDQGSTMSPNDTYLRGKASALQHTGYRMQDTPHSTGPAAVDLSTTRGGAFGGRMLAWLVDLPATRRWNVECSRVSAALPPKSGSGLVGSFSHPVLSVSRVWLSSLSRKPRKLGSF